MLGLKSLLEGKSHVIWDWNGTLLDDVPMVVGAIAKLLEQHALPIPTIAQYREIFCFPVSEYYQRLGFDFEKASFESLSDQFVAHYLEGIPKCQLHAGTRELLQGLQATGISQSVLSAAHEASLHKHLAHFDIARFFDRIYGLSDHHAKGKVERGLELMKDSGHAAADTVLIGDTDHDLEVGKQLGVDVVLLGDGHQSYERLIQLHDKVVRDRHAANLL